MKKHHHLSLIGALVFSSFAFSDNSDDVWTYQNNNGTTLEQACHNRTTCEHIYTNSYYSAFVNNRSETDCSIGDLLIVQHKSRTFKKFDTGTCSNSASIEVSKIESLHYIEVVNGDRLIKRYPLDSWKLKDKVNEAKISPPKEPNHQPTAWKKRDNSFTISVFEPIEINCSYREADDVIYKSGIRYRSIYGVQIINEVEVDGKRLSANVKNQDEWTQLVQAILSASRITGFVNSRPVVIWLTKPTQLDRPCNYYQG